MSLNAGSDVAGTDEDFRLEADRGHPRDRRGWEIIGAAGRTDVRAAAEITAAEPTG